MGPRRPAAALAAVLLLSGCTEQDPLAESVGQPVTTVYERDGQRVAVYDVADLGTCFAYHLPGVGGSSCLRALQPAGWAVEVTAAHGLLMVGGHPRTHTVRLPRRGGGEQEVTLRRVEGVRHPVAVVPLADDVVLEGNGVRAFDAQGDYLGRTHECGGDPDACGPFDGPLDQASRPR